MGTPSTSPQRAPLYTWHKSVAAVETLPITDPLLGMNMTGYTHAHIQILPAGGANPTIQVLWWSEELAAFVREHTAISKTGVGANTAFEFTVECRDRIMLVAVTTLAAGTAKVLVAGHNPTTRS